MKLYTAVALLAATCTCAREDSGNRQTAEQWVEKQSQQSGRPTTQTSAESTPGPSNRKQPATDTSAHAVESDGLLVNNQVVTINDILEPIQPQIDEMASSLSPELYYRRVVDLVRQQVIDSVAHLLIYRKASETVTEEMEPAIKKAIETMERERISREFNGRETEYENYLQTKRKTRDEVKERLRRIVVVDSYLRERLLQLIPSPTKRELARYYQEHLRDFTQSASRELYLIDIPVAAFYDREILLRRRPPLPEEEQIAEQKARDEIEAAMREINAGEPFEEVAKKRSHGPHKEEGGFWGDIQSPMAGRWKVPYEKFVTMREGEVSGIIEASKAYFIVKVGKVREAKTQSFEDVQPEMVSAIRNQKFHRQKGEFLQRELEKSTIGSLDRFVAQVLASVPKPESETKAQR